MSDGRRGTGALLPVFLALVAAAGPAAALAPGDAAPSFVLPWLAGDERVGSTELFSERDATVLMIWDRGCPHCTEVALSSAVFADSLARRGARLVGVVMGPDDRSALEDLFWENALLVPHLWDEGRRLASLYGLGFQHLGIFVIDRSGTVRAVFDDTVHDPVEEVLPAVVEALSRPAALSRAPPGMAPREGPILRIDGRIRLLSTEGARRGDTGLFGEELENGTLLLHRWELRAVWSLAPGIEFTPWLRIGNESDEVLTEGADRLSSRYGSASLGLSRGRVSATLGAFDLKVSPLLLMRWDEEDAPPLGGASGCGVCGAGASGLQQRSLEVLEPEFTFEGISASVRRRYARVAGWVAVPQWEDPSPDKPFEARYRRILSGASLDLGRTADIDPRLGLPRGLGLRFGLVSVADDRRTLDPGDVLYLPPDDDRTGRVLLARVGPWRGISAEGEWIDWRREIGGTEQEASALRIGLTGERRVGPVGLWGRAHRIRTDRLFDAEFRALTYDANREGWRLAGGLALRPPGGGRERFGISFFYRGVEETEPEVAPAAGAYRYRVSSLSLSVRPEPRLLLEATGLLLEDRSPVPGEESDRTRGFAADLRWEGIPVLDPALHLEAIRSDLRGADPVTIWQTYISVRISK